MEGRYTLLNVMESWQCRQNIINTFQGIFKNTTLFLNLVIRTSKVFFMKQYDLLNYHPIIAYECSGNE